MKKRKKREIERKGAREWAGLGKGEWEWGPEGWEGQEDDSGEMGETETEIDSERSWNITIYRKKKKEKNSILKGYPINGVEVLLTECQQPPIMISKYGTHEPGSFGGGGRCFISSYTCSTRRLSFKLSIEW